MQSQLERIHGAGIELVGISYDPVSVLREFADEKSIEFPLLSDISGDKVGVTIRDYSLLDERESGRYYGVPVPATVVVGRDHRIRLVLQGSVTRRHTVEDLIQKVVKLDD